MVYLFESNLSPNKSVTFALTKVFGLGKFNSVKIAKKLGLSSNYKVKSLSKEQISKMILTVEELPVVISSDLRKLKSIKFKSIVELKSYKSFRLKQGLPARGQRTHTNAKSSRKRFK